MFSSYTALSRTNNNNNSCSILVKITTICTSDALCAIRIRISDKKFVKLTFKIWNLSKLNNQNIFFLTNKYGLQSLAVSDKIHPLSSPSPYLIDIYIDAFYHDHSKIPLKFIGSFFLIKNCNRRLEICRARIYIYIYMCMCMKGQ